MSTLRTAVHSIFLPGDGEGAEAIEIAPGRVFEVPEKDLEFFTKIEAVREPTEAEVALYERAIGQVSAKAAEEEAPKEPETPKTGKAAKTATTEAGGAAASDGADVNLG